MEKIKKDWKGNKASTFKTIGASNHTEEERERHDYYATSPKATRLLLSIETFNKKVWEPACGEGHISEVLRAAGHEVKSTDLVDRGYEHGTGNFDFLGWESTNLDWDGDIITNPPYIYAIEFVQRAYLLTKPGAKIAMFLKLTFLESSGRKEFFRHFNPKTVWVSCSRLICAKNGKFEDIEGSATAYAWFVWENGYRGETVIKWFN